MLLVELLQAFQLELRILAEVVLAMALGGVIGFEREMRDKPAGLRTHMLVTGAAALLVALGDVMIRHFDTSLPSQLVRSDPATLIEAIVAGVSFLGAGTIIRGRGEHIEGLTTAASLLFAAAVGVAVALSQILLAVGATIVVLLTLRGLGLAERFIVRTNKPERGEE